MKVEWPSDAKLKKILASKSFVAIGQELDVSDNAVRKRCKARGFIPCPIFVNSVK